MPCSMNSVSSSSSIQTLPPTPPRASRAGPGADAPDHSCPDKVLPPHCSSKETSPPRGASIGIGFSQADMTGAQSVACHPSCLRDCRRPPWLGPRLPLQQPWPEWKGNFTESCNLRRNKVPTFTFLMGMGHKGSTVEDGKH